MHHDPAQAFLIAALASVGLVMLVPLIIWVRNKLFFFDWPPLYEWQQARRQLHRIDRGRVIWATYFRHHTASRAALADAQLACARYRQAAAQRALDRELPRRRVAAMFFGVLAVSLAALAATHSQQRIIFIWGAAAYAFSALGNLVEGRRSLKRLTERMARLQAEIQDCYGRRSDAAPTRRQEPGLPHSA